MLQKNIQRTDAQPVVAVVALAAGRNDVRGVGLEVINALVEALGDGRGYGKLDLYAQRGLGHNRLQMLDQSGFSHLTGTPTMPIIDDQANSRRILFSNNRSYAKKESGYPNRATHNVIT
jgi:hypothetical protein